LLIGRASLKIVIPCLIAVATSSLSSTTPSSWRANAFDCVVHWLWILNYISNIYLNYSYLYEHYYYFKHYFIDNYCYLQVNN
jgi:hypothetical protein